MRLLNYGLVAGLLMLFGMTAYATKQKSEIVICDGAQTGLSTCSQDEVTLWNPTGNAPERIKFEFATVTNCSGVEVTLVGLQVSGGREHELPGMPMDLDTGTTNPTAVTYEWPTYHIVKANLNSPNPCDELEVDYVAWYKQP